MKINLAGFKKIVSNADRIELTGSADAANTYDNSQNIVPVRSAFKVSRTFDYVVPAMSLTVIRIKTKQQYLLMDPCVIFTARPFQLYLSPVFNKIWTTIPVSIV